MKLKSATVFWSNGVLRLPTTIMRVFHKRLAEHGLPSEYKPRQQRFGYGQVGGSSDDEALAHFAVNFAGAVGRSAGVYLDAKSAFDVAGAVLRTATLDGSLCLVDAPSGAAAASLGVLTVVSDLRRQSVLPSSPLNVHLVFADVSKLARELSAQNARELAPTLAQVGIEISWEELQWDVRSQPDAISVVDAVRAKSPTTTLVLVSAFSEAFKHGFDTDFSVIATLMDSHGLPCALIWAEPAPPKSKRFKGKEMLEKLKRKLTHTFSLTPSSGGVGKDSFSVLDTVEPNAAPFDVHVAAHSFFNAKWQK